MKMQRRWTVATIGFWMLCGSVFNPTNAASIRDGRDDQQVLAHFLADLKQRQGIDEQRLARIEQLVTNAASRSISEAVTEGLMALYPHYGPAVQDAESGVDARRLETLRSMSMSDDRFLAADASFHLARALVNQERFEDALPLLNELTGSLADFSTHGSSVAYFLGVVHAGMLQNQQAIVAWLDFLDRFPHAPERLRVTAWRQIQQLQSIKEGQLDDVHQRMDFSRRRLEIVETGDRTQEEQDHIVKILAKLIKEAEKNECSNCSGKKPADGENQQQAQQQPAPQENSRSQQGGMSNVANGRFVDRNYDSGIESDWSKLRDRSRDAANAAFKDKRPARHRDIVERFFDSINNIK